MEYKTWNTVIQKDLKATVNSISAAAINAKEPCFVSYDKAAEGVLGSKPKLQLIESRDYKFAHEAGVYIPSANKEYFTSNYQDGETIRIFELDCDTYGITEIAQGDQDSTPNANGGCNYKGNVLLCCQGSLVRPSSLVLMSPKQELGAMVDNFHGRQFNSINDVVVHHSTGDIWFTDPTYGWQQGFRPPPQLPSQVYRLNPITGQVSCVADGFKQCNGLCFSPDYSRLYVTDTAALQARRNPEDGFKFKVDPTEPSSIYVFDVVDNGTRLANRRMFAFCDSGVPDGIKCDKAGNVYSGCGDGIHVWDQSGKLICKIFIGSTVANFNFAPQGIWVLAEERLFLCNIAQEGALAEIEGHTKPADPFLNTTRV